MRSLDWKTSVSLGVSCEAKTARPAVWVWRISKSGEVGAPAGRPDGASIGGAEEEDDGLETLEAVCMEAAPEESPSVVSMARRDTVTMYAPRIMNTRLFANWKQYNCKLKIVNDDRIDQGHFRMSWIQEPVVNDRMKYMVVLSKMLRRSNDNE